MMKLLTPAETAGRFTLARDGHVAVAAVPGLLVRVRSGSLWLTQDRDPVDHLVTAGQCFVADRRGRLVATALHVTEVEVEWPRPRTQAAGPRQLPAAA